MYWIPGGAGRQIFFILILNTTIILLSYPAEDDTFLLSTGIKDESEVFRNFLNIFVSYLV